MLLSAARYIFDKNIIDKRDPVWALLTTSVLADTIDSRLENLLERPAMPAYARSHIVPLDEVGVYHCMAQCVRRAFLCGVDPLTNHRLRLSQGMDPRTTRAPCIGFRDRYLRCRSSSTSICHFSIGPVDSFGRRVKGRSRLSSRPFWSDWESSTTAGSRQCGNSVAGSRKPSADPMRWRPSLLAGARPGSRAATPLPWPFDSRPLGHPSEPDRRVISTHCIVRQHRASPRWSRRETLRGPRSEPALVRSSGAHSPRSETIMVTDAYDRKSGSLG
jgi:hypothetical protein